MKASNGHIVNRVCVTHVLEANAKNVPCLDILSRVLSNSALTIELQGQIEREWIEEMSRVTKTEIELVNDDGSITMVYLTGGEQFVVEDDDGEMQSPDDPDYGDEFEVDKPPEKPIGEAAERESRFRHG